MEDPTQNRWDKITHISLVVSCAIVLVFGVAGYVTFTGFSQGDLLENYCMSDNLALIARLLFTVTIMLTYPIECFVVRDVLEHAVWDGKPPQTTNHHVMVTLIIVMSVFIFSTLTDCLGIVLELNGVLAAVPLAYILPAVTYLKLEPGRTLTWPKAPAFLLALFGTLVAVCGTVYAILNVLDGVTCSHGTEMPYCADASVYKFMEHAQNVTKFNETLIRNGINDLATTTIGVSLIEP
ncbi:putative sodium-coupled neutral amino acid transporter 11 [Halotydeus destructor]|nr:putative sodium-coupled neutral amino acid transporter 11 [Halotydeus destructor]